MSHRVTIAVLGALALGASLQAQCATISLCVEACPQPPSQAVVQQGSNFMVTLLINATDVPGPTSDLYGGAVVLDFDPTRVTYNPDSLLLAGIASFYQPLATGVAGARQTLSFGFNNAPEVGTVATLTFKAIGAPGSSTDIGIADDEPILGTFASYYPGYQPFVPDFTGTSLQVSEVPLPGAVWLIVTAFGALLGRVRRAPRTGPAA